MRVGDTVKLKSGGPLMTVTKLNALDAPQNRLIDCEHVNTGFVRTRWFVGDIMCEDVFPKAALEITVT